MRWPAILGERTTAIGLDIGSHSVKAAQVVGGKLAAAVAIPRQSVDGGPLSLGEISTLAAKLRGRPFRGRSVVVAVPNGQLMTGILELPPRSSGAPIEQLARMELARRYNVEPEAVETCCWDLPSPVRAASRTCVMAVACRRHDSDLLLDALEGQGLNVTAVDVHALALARACSPMLAPAEGTGAILDVGHDSARLVLVYRGTVVYERDLTRHGGRTLAALAEQDAEQQHDAAGSPDEVDMRLDGDGLPGEIDSMAAEIRTPLSYLTSQYSDASVGRLLIVGGGSGIAGLSGGLADRLGIETLCPPLSFICQCDESFSKLGPSMAVAVGLAQYAEVEK